jgi:hypothetical protein
MSVTDTSEKGLETLMMCHMTGTDGLTAAPDWMAAETPKRGQLMVLSYSVGGDHLPSPAAPRRTALFEARGVEI